MRGIPFEEALQVAADDCPYASLRHFFLHLDIGVNVGGKIGNSLRSLANHSHNEWKLSVEARVRKLENLVVFPVFGSVIGLVLLTAAVPLISLLDLKDRLDATQGISDENQILEAKQ
jgi:type II secretory pathway component PulF